MASGHALLTCAGIFFVMITFSEGAFAADPGDVVAGEKIYKQTCVACHGEDGAGALPGIPDLTGKSSHLATRSHKVLLQHMLNGFQDSRSPLSMPPKGGNDSLTIKDLRDVLAYMHEKFQYKPGNGR